MTDVTPCANNLIETTDGPWHFCRLPLGHGGQHQSPDGVTTWFGPCGEEREAIRRARELADAWADSWYEPLQTAALELRRALDGDTSIPIREGNPDGLEFIDPGEETLS